MVMAATALTRSMVSPAFVRPATLGPSAKKVGTVNTTTVPIMMFNSSNKTILNHRNVTPNVEQRLLEFNSFTSSHLLTLSRDTFPVCLPTRSMYRTILQIQRWYAQHQ